MERETEEKEQRKIREDAEERERLEDERVKDLLRFICLNAQQLMMGYSMPKFDSL